MRLIDAGTAYTKIWEDGEVSVLRTDKVPSRTFAEIATGHNASRHARRTVNELIALAHGGLQLIPDPDFVLVDVGCRDIKKVRFENSRYAGCGWNDSCGALSGFTLDLLRTYFDLDFHTLSPAEERLSFTCGIFGLSEMFDRISSGTPVEQSVSELVGGLADRVFEFAEHPRTLWMSGGLCENPLFLNSFPCTVHPLGRNVLLHGLEELSKRS